MTWEPTRDHHLIIQLHKLLENAGFPSVQTENSIHLTYSDRKIKIDAIGTMINIKVVQTYYHFITNYPKPILETLFERCGELATCNLPAKPIPVVLEALLPHFHITYPRAIIYQGSLGVGGRFHTYLVIDEGLIINPHPTAVSVYCAGVKKNRLNKKPERYFELNDPEFLTKLDKEVAETVKL